MLNLQTHLTYMQLSYSATMTWQCGTLCTPLASTGCVRTYVCMYVCMCVFSVNTSDNTDCQCKPVTEALIVGRLGHVGLCQLCTKVYCTQMTKAYVTKTFCNQLFD